MTANRQLVARHRAELFAAASEAGVQLRLKASVCGAIPVAFGSCVTFDDVAREGIEGVTPEDVAAGASSP